MEQDQFESSIRQKKSILKFLLNTLTHVFVIKSVPQLCSTRPVQRMSIFTFQCFGNFLKFVGRTIKTGSNEHLGQFRKLKTRKVKRLRVFNFVLLVFWRRERDSNPRTCYSQRFSRPPHSTALPSLRRKSKVSSIANKEILN